MSEDKLVNCICNSNLSSVQRANLVALVNGMKDARAICKRAKKHNFQLWKERSWTTTYRCTVCGIVSSTGERPIEDD